MNEQSIEQPIGPLEAQLANVAHNFSYPPTPDIAGSIEQQLAATPAQPAPYPRRLAWAVTIAALAMVVLLAIPPVRTTVVEVLRTGVVRIFLMEPVATTTPLLTITPPVPVEATTNASPQPAQTTPRPSATPISSILDSARETTETQTQVSLPVHLPTRSLETKPPDKVTQFRTNLWAKKPDHPSGPD